MELGYINIYSLLLRYKPAKMESVLILMEKCEKHLLLCISSRHQEMRHYWLDLCLSLPSSRIIHTLNLLDLTGRSKKMLNPGNTGVSPSVRLLTFSRTPILSTVSR
jgi:hypothetical protein